jgi:predicted metal-dependent hydrolase
MLARTTEKMKRLTAYCGEKYPDKANVRRLVKGFNPQKISETLPTSEHTAYSENKGEKIAFCLDKKKHTPLDEHGISRESKMIDPNTLMFVAIHEMAHVATESIGHGDEFWENFKFLLEVAAEVGVYSPEDYKKQPQEYCGMRITDNPYYDM